MNNTTITAPAVNGGDLKNERLFFNDESGFDFANSLGGKLSRLFSSAIGGLGLGSGGGESFSTGMARMRTISAMERESTNCESGTITTTTTIDNNIYEIGSVNVVFDSCLQNGETSNGSIAVSVNDLNFTSGGTVVVNVSGFTVLGGDDPVSMNGQVYLTIASTDDDESVSMKGDGFSIAADGEIITFSRYAVEANKNGISGGSTLSADVVLVSSIDGTISVKVDPPLVTVNGSAEYPASGAITMTHSDGSSLLINASNGNLDTFDYTVNENGAITSGTAKWADTDIDL